MPIFRQEMIPLFLLLLTFLLLENRDFSQAQSSPVSLSNLNRLIGITGAFFLATYALLKNGIPTRLPVILKLYSIYLFTALLSSFFYSDWFFYSIWKVLEVSTTFIIIIYFVRLHQINENALPTLYQTCLGFFKFLIIMTIIGVFLNPDMALLPPTGEATVEAFGEAIVPYQLFGTIFRINANSLGGMAAILFLVSGLRVLYAPRSRSNKIWVFISFSVLILAQSRTAWLGLFASILLLLLINKSISKTFKFISWGVIFIGLTVFLSNILLYLTRGVSFNNLQNLSGRSVWWKIAIDEYFNSSFFEQVIGLGYMTSSRTILSAALDKTVATLHSDYMDALISTGIIGLFCLLFVSIGLFVNVIKASRIPELIVLELSGISIILIIRTITGTTIATHNIFLLLFLTISTYLSYIIQKNLSVNT